MGHSRPVLEQQVGSKVAFRLPSRRKLHARVISHFDRSLEYSDPNRDRSLVRCGDGLHLTVGHAVMCELLPW